MRNKMTINYSILDPTGNVTALCESPVPVSEQPRIAAEIMKLEPTVEQVGFLSYEDAALPSLRMAGGEFCGNATLSAASLALLKGLRSPSERGSIHPLALHVSGASEPVQVRLKQISDSACAGEVSMPEALEVSMVRLPQTLEISTARLPQKTGASASPDPDNDTACIELPLVRFAGISHLILEETSGETKISDEDAESLIGFWCSELHCDGLGIMFLNQKAGTLRPLVWVPESGTLFWEHSCASGTTAAGIWLSVQSGGPGDFQFREPGGVLGVRTEAGGKHPVLNGRAELVCQKSLTI